MFCNCVSINAYLCLFWGLFHQTVCSTRDGTMSIFFSPSKDSVEFSHSVVSDSLRPHELHHARPPCPSPTQSLPKLMSIESMMPSNHLILCRPLFLLPSVFLSIRVFSNESALRIRWPKYSSFSFSISSSNEHPGLISFRMEWLDLLAVQGILKSLLQHHNSKASILQRSAFFIVQLSHPYMTTEKTIAFTRRTFVDKVMSLLFNMLSRLVMEKAMAPHSSTLAWKIPWTEKPGRLQSIGLLRVRHD